MPLALHDDLLAGERAAVAITLFVGHVMLNGRFSMMTGIYLTFVAWQWLV